MPGHRIAPAAGARITLTARLQPLQALGPYDLGLPLGLDGPAGGVEGVGAGCGRGGHQVVGGHDDVAQREVDALGPDR